MAQLTCKDLCLGYDGKVIVENINFSVSQGGSLYILGENGSGKSTLVKTILGLMPPVSGTVETSDGLSPTQIGYLPQQTMVQKDFPASVREVVMSGFAGKSGLRPFYTKEEKRACAENMKKMGISDFASRCYRELSGGQQQRVLLARALCAADKMLLLDEPVAGLDPKVSHEMYETIDTLNKKYKMTIIMVSHDIPAALKYATHILHVGSEVFFGTLDQYLGSQLGSHYTKIHGGGEK